MVNYYWLIGWLMVGHIWSYLVTLSGNIPTIGRNSVNYVLPHPTALLMLTSPYSGIDKYWRFVTHGIIGHSPILDILWDSSTLIIAVYALSSVSYQRSVHICLFSTLPAPPVVRPCQPKSHKMKVVSCNNPGNCLSHSRLQLVIRVNIHSAMLPSNVICVFIHLQSTCMM